MTGSFQTLQTSVLDTANPCLQIVLSFAVEMQLLKFTFCGCQDMSYGKGYGDYKGYGEILTCFLFNDLHNPKQVQIASVDYNMIE